MATRGRKSAPRRHDGPGRYDPNYTRELLAKSGQRRRQRDVGVAFSRVYDDDLAEEMGASFLESAVMSSHALADHREAIEDEEFGGPFITTRAREELARGSDLSNPPESFREPFPMAVGAGPEDDSDLAED